METMTQEDKELLLKDLCSRLPYGVKVLVDNKHWIDFDGRTPSKLTFDNSYRLLYVGTKLGYVKPYLFPLSSMSEEQQEEYEEALVYHDYIPGGWTIAKSFDNEYIIPYWFVDFCNKNHLDYRGLIEKGLAIDATGLNIY